MRVRIFSKNFKKTTLQQLVFTKTITQTLLILEKDHKFAKEKAMNLLAFKVAVLFSTVSLISKTISSCVLVSSVASGSLKVYMFTPGSPTSNDVISPPHQDISHKSQIYLSILLFRH